MSRFGSGLKLPTKPPRRTLKAEILWGDENGGSYHFPKDMATISSRMYSFDPSPLEPFRKAVISAVERVWIVDEYFLVSDREKNSDKRITKILDWLHVDLIASDIRILTKQHDEITEKTLQRFQTREQEINHHQARRAKVCSIQINTRLTRSFNYIHDRFAIVDDELWHFGATVGGFHASVNAASRGWDAVEMGAIEFFELAWEKCKER